MNIKHELPPNYEKIKKYFPDADYDKGVVFTYGDTCYCKNITPDLVVHEETHTKQQVNTEEWWNKYYIDPEFRLSQEAEAYHNQWLWIEKNIKDRNFKSKLLHHIVSSLAGPLYNNLLTYSEAMKVVKYGNKQ